MDFAHNVDLRSMVVHANWVAASTSVEEAQRLFETGKHSFMAVIDGDQVLGICSKRDIGNRLGTRYGFAIYARKPVAMFVQNHSRVTTRDTFTEALSKIFGRPDNTTFDDVLLVDQTGAFIGLLAARDLVRLQTRILLENAAHLERQNREIEERRAELEAEILMAKEIQNAFLPQHYPIFRRSVQDDRSALRFAHHYESASSMGGDFFSIRKISETTAGIFFGDVMGHGVRSALITAMLRALVEEIAGKGLSPGAVLEHINQELFAILKNAHTQVFVSCLFVEIDLGSNVLRFANGGHPPPLLLHQGMVNRASPLVAPNCRNGLVLGLLPDARYETHSVIFQPGSGLFLFTDGAVEIERGGLEFGTEKLTQTIEESYGRGAESVIETVVREIRLFAGAEPIADDICLLAVERAR